MLCLQWFSCQKKLEPVPSSSFPLGCQSSLLASAFSLFLSFTYKMRSLASKSLMQLQLYKAEWRREQHAWTKGSLNDGEFYFNSAPITHNHGETNSPGQIMSWWWWWTRGRESNRDSFGSGPEKMGTNDSAHSQWLISFTLLPFPPVDK